MGKVLVIGALGQIGTELTVALREKHGRENVISSDIDPHDDPHCIALDAKKKEDIEGIIRKNEITIVYHLAAYISAKGEEDPIGARNLNLGSLFNVLDLSREYNLKIFWPSSIAAFGKTTPKTAGQHTITEPVETFYGATKIAGELFCANYHRKFGIDVRSIRYPGIISYKHLPQGGTTDYAAWMIHDALTKGTFDCFLRPDTRLPLMYIDDCVRATLELMDAKSERISIRTSYNLKGFSCTPKELEEEIKKHFPTFTVRYIPDFHQDIADNWPGDVVDTDARNDWGWKPEYNLAKMTKTMLEGVRAELAVR